MRILPHLRELSESLEDWISEDLANDLPDLAGFRNVLVHTYRELDLDVIYGIFQNDLRFLLTLKKIVKELLEEM